MISCKKVSILLTVWLCSICNACIPTSGGGDCCREGGGGSCCQPQTQIQVSCTSCSQDSVESYQQPAPQYQPVPFYQPPVEYHSPAQYQPPVLPQQPILVQPNSLNYQAQPPAYENVANPPAPQQQIHSLTDDSMMFPLVQPAQDRVHSPSEYMEVPPPTLPPSLPLFPTENPRPPSAQHQVDPSEHVNYVSELPLTPPVNPPGNPTLPPSLHLFPTEIPRPPCAQQQVEPSEQVDDMHEAPSTSANYVSELPLTPPANPPENPLDESNLHMMVSENKDDQPNNLDINMLPNTLPHGSTNGDDYDGPKSNISPEQRDYSMDGVSTSPLSMATTTPLANSATEAYGESDQEASASNNSASYTSIEHSGYNHSSSSSFYNTYNDQACTGETLFRTREKSLRRALTKCALLGCAAANIEPIPLGIQVDFLKNVDKRVSDQKRHCLSRYDVPLFTDNMWQIEKELHFENTEKESTDSSPLLRRRPLPSAIFRPQRVRFVTSEPKSSY